MRAVTRLNICYALVDLLNIIFHNTLRFKIKLTAIVRFFKLPVRVLSSRHFQQYSLYTDEYGVYVTV